MLKTSAHDGTKPPNYMTTNMKKYYDNLAKKEVKIITDYKIYKKRKEQLKSKENLIIVYMRNIMKNIFYDLDVVNNIIVLYQL